MHCCCFFPLWIWLVITRDEGVREICSWRLACCEPICWWLSYLIHRLDEDQLMSMFGNNSNSLQKQQQQQQLANKNPKSDSVTNAASANTAGCSSGNNTTQTSGLTAPAKHEKPSTPSDSNSLSEVSNEEVRAAGPEKPKGEPEVQSTRDGDGFTQPFSKGELQQALAGLDSSLDPKRAKRWARKKTKQQCRSDLPFVILKVLISKPLHRPPTA